MKSLLFTFIILVSAFPIKAQRVNCPYLSITNQFFTDFSIVRPTQAIFGSLPISDKIKKIEKSFKKNKLQKYLKKKFAPVVIGPNCMLHITDRHHTSYSILKSNIPYKDKQLFVKVVHDWSNKTQYLFEKDMILNKYTWLKDSESRSIEFSQLPKSVLDLVDYPYRSLAWKVRELGGFSKVNLPFLEFYWADFFKDNGIILKSSSSKDIKKVLDKAITLAHSRKAKHMPGYLRAKLIKIIIED